MFKRLLLASVVFLSGVGLMPAQGFKKQVMDLFQANDYDGLETLYQKAAGGPFVIHDKWPDLTEFFTGLEPKDKDAEDVWKTRLASAEAWLSARPESNAAVLTVAALYNDYGYKARGTGWAKDVTPEGWKLFSGRRAYANGLLDKNAARLDGEVAYHYLLMRINAPSGETFPVAQKHAAILAERQPGFFPAYWVMANYLLPRWYGEAGDLAAYAKESADRLGGSDGDMLYSELLGYAAYMDEDVFVENHRPDLARMQRGTEAALAAVGLDRTARYPILATAAYASGVSGNWRQAGRQLLELGVAYNFRYWNGRENYEAHLKNSGVRTELLAARLLEQQGKLEQAEAAYVSFVTDKTKNPWLAGFYLRHGRVKEYAASMDAVDVSRPVETLTMDEAAEECRILSALGLFDRARQVAARFDRARGHNITGKLALYHAALYTGDAAAANAARESIINLKTDRRSYQQAQAVLRNKTTVTPAGENAPDWNDGYVYQAVIAIALGYYEAGRADEARALLSAAIDRCLVRNEREWMNALWFHPPVRPVTSPAR